MCGILVAILPKTTKNAFRTGGDGGDRGDRGRGGSSTGSSTGTSTGSSESKDANLRFETALQTLKRRGPDSTTIQYTKYTAFGKNHLHTSFRRCIKSSWTYVIDGCIDDDLGYLLNTYGVDTPKHCSGAFAFVAFHPIVGIVASRDIMGISPLYIGIVTTAEGSETWFSSELKGLQHCDWTNSFPIGAVYNGCTFKTISQPHVRQDSLFNLLRSAVEKQIRVEVPWGVLLSGGANSSIIASLTRFCERPRGYPVLHTFTIGIPGSRNIEAARLIAKELQSVHHEILYTPEEGMQELTNVISTIESYDNLLVQKSIPMYILAKHIRRSGIKVILSGLGADELFNLSNKLYTGCIVNKCMASQGIACRVPYLDTSVVHLADKCSVPTNIRKFFKCCVPRDVIHSTISRKWIRTCESYGEHRFKLIFSTLFPARI